MSVGLELNDDWRIDGMLFHRLVESELPHSLGFAGSMYTEAPSWKTDRNGKKKAFGSETDFELHEYCGYDVAVTAEVLTPLIKRVKERYAIPIGLMISKRHIPNIKAQHS